MRVLIFGCGYLGRRVAKAWVDGGSNVFAMTRSSLNAESLCEFGIQPLIGDICEPDSLKSLPEVDLVLHAVGYDRNSGRTKQEVACDGLQNVLSAIKGRCSKLIYISSTSVYGQSAGEWVDENSICLPIQPAGQVALAAEQLVQTFASSVPEMRIAILRLAGIYGPNRLLTRIESLRAGEPIAGRGDSWLNLIHVEDAAAVVLKCAIDEFRSRTFLVVDDCPIPRSLFYGRLAQMVAAPTPSFDESQPSLRGSGGLNKRCSNRRLKADLGWHPVYSSIDSGLPATLGNFANKLPDPSE